MKNISLPTISLITPSYNQAPYLEECIDSILSQNYPNLEYKEPTGSGLKDCNLKDSSAILIN